MYWTAFSLLENEDDAQDIVQDTFIALIISKEGLDAKQVDDQTEMIEYLWEDCDLRARLNGEVYDKSFSDDEKQIINKSTVKFERRPEEYAFASEENDVED